MITNLNYFKELPSPFRRIYETLQPKTNLNEVRVLFSSGWDLVNAPIKQGLCILTMPYAGDSYLAQICIGIETTSSEIWIRTKNNTLGWSKWRVISRQDY